MHGKAPVFFSDYILEFTYFTSQDVLYYERSIYTGLDLLGDMGGLFETLCTIGKIVLFTYSFLTKEGPHNYILPKLFK